MFRRLFLIAACALSLPAIAACGPSPQTRCAEAAKPAECLQVAQAGGDVSDYLTYGMAGYMLSSAINGGGQRQSVIVADPSYHGSRWPIAGYQASPAHVHRGTVTTVSTKRGLFGGTTTTTRTSSWSSGSRSSPYRSSYRTSSFSSRRR
ncbi:MULTISPECIES: hypothetical protein [unclassified Sphingomonas]|uniref:hypothetical protein n=1 Tax=unclassified Sphingomonas TaxID=196159 RepID=UPI00226A7E05|nr:MULTISPECIES: hypothetical protein [unclassified Sphingomonas]